MMINENEGFKILRKEKKISQTELSKKSGIHRNYISDFENGRNNPTDKTIRKLLEPLGINYVDFLIDYCGANQNEDTTHVDNTIARLEDGLNTGFVLDGIIVNKLEQELLESVIKNIRHNRKEQTK